MLSYLWLALAIGLLFTALMLWAYYTANKADRSEQEHYIKQLNRQADKLSRKG